MSEFTLKNGMKLYYQDFGSGQPVVLMHGWTSSHKIYSVPVKRLKKKHVVSSMTTEDMAAARMQIKKRLRWKRLPLI